MPKQRLINKKNNPQKTYKELLEEYLIKLETENRSKFTIKSYKQMNTRFIKFIGEDFLCKDITYETLENFIKESSKVNKASTIKTHLVHIVAILNYGAELNYNKKIKRPYITVGEPKRKVYSQEDLIKLLRVDKNETFMQTQTRIIIATFLSTGLRLSELTSLKIKDLDLKEGVIYSRHTKNKKNRILPVSKSLKKLLVEWLSIRRHDSEEEPLFCNSYGEELVQETLRTLVYRYHKIRGVKDTSIHQYRRTFITNAINKGVDIISLSRITGHSSLKMLNIYYVSNKENIKALADVVSPLEDLKASKRKFANKK